MHENQFDKVMEGLTRSVAQHSSRRGFIGRIGAVTAGAMLLPLLPVDRRSGEAHAVVEKHGWTPQSQDTTRCDYWRHCALDGQICDCCGGSLLDCPPGTTLSPSSWVASCYNPSDGQSYLIAYRDCCGKSICPRCGCYNTIGKRPIYRPEFSNDIIWCFGAEGSSYHCTLMPIVGKSS